MGWRRLAVGLWYCRAGYAGPKRNAVYRWEADYDVAKNLLHHVANGVNLQNITVVQRQVYAGELVGRLRFLMPCPRHGGDSHGAVLLARRCSGGANVATVPLV